MAETTTTEKPEKKAPPTAEQQRLEELFGPLNAGDSIKVRHIVTDGKTGKNVRAICAILTDLQAVTDLERHIYDHGVEQGWESGDYMAELVRPGHGGAIKYGFFSFRFPSKPASVTAATSPLELVRQAKEILGTRQEASPDKVLESVTAAMRVGADAAGSKAPASDATAVLLKPLIEGLVARLGKEPAAPVAGPDPFALLERLEKMGLIGQHGETDKPKPLVEQIGELKELVDVIGGLAGPAGPAAEPTAVVVARIFAPYVPQVLTTINNVVDVVKMRFGMGGPIMPPPAAPTPPRAVGPPPLPPAVQAFITRTQAAIATDDDGFFPAFADGITTHIVDGRNFLLAIQSGHVEEEQALVAVQGTGLLNPAEPRTRAWLIRFVHWLRAAQPMAAAASSPAAASPAAPPAASAVIARCERCAQEYRFDSREDFEQDTRICDNQPDNAPAGAELCKGNIVLLVTEGDAP